MKKKIRIKLCGFTRKADVLHAVNLGADAIGLVFYPASKRFVDCGKANELLSVLPSYVPCVGLFVNADFKFVIKVLEKVELTMLQFHGDEDFQYCQKLINIVEKPFLKAVRIKPETTSESLLELENTFKKLKPFFSGLLFDSWTDEFGGSGKTFDWKIIPKDLAARNFLSGGLTHLNVTDVVKYLKPFAVDVSSGIEIRKGLKDKFLIDKFISSVKLF
tara:strand:- start:2131 stop:2784 length:654 start_codon:yes stop_codon:yes gene_type:complete